MGLSKLPKLLPSCRQGRKRGVRGAFEELKSRKEGGDVLKCLEGLDWELLDLSDSLSVTVTFTGELWANLSGVGRPRKK